MGRGRQLGCSPDGKTQGACSPRPVLTRLMCMDVDREGQCGCGQRSEHEVQVWGEVQVYNVGSNCAFCCSV